jgi:hypothetical protein
MSFRVHIAPCSKPRHLVIRCGLTGICGLTYAGVGVTMGVILVRVVLGF